MKTFKRYFRVWAAVLGSLVLLQSCTVYHASTSSADQAIASQSKVKIKVANDDPYIFKKLERHDDTVYGLANTNSTTYKRLREQVKDDSNQGKYALILLQEKDLKNIHEKNKGASTAINIGVPVVAVGIGAGIAVANASVDLNWNGN